MMRSGARFFPLLWLGLVFTAGPLYSAEVVESFANEPVFSTKVRLLEAGQGQATTLLLVHGVGDEGAEIWRELLPELAQSYHVVACDLPGFGKSDKPNVLYSPENFSKFLTWLVKRNTSGRFILVGHSLGGALALHYAATAAVKPDKLILIDAAGILHRAVLTKFFLHFKITDDQSYAPSASLSWLERLAGTMVEKFQGFPVSLDLLLNSAFMRDKFLGAEPNKIAGLALVQTNFTLLIPQVATPTFLLWGEDDDVAPLRTGRLLAMRLPQAQLELIPAGGHVPMQRQPVAFRQALWRALQTPPVIIPPGTAAESDRVGRCTDQEDAHFSGHYRRIELLRCQSAQIVDVTAHELSAIDSQVTIERSVINGNAVGLHTVRSYLLATALDISADLPILTEQSSFDFAGVTLKARGKQLVGGAGNPSRLLFSVSLGQTPAGQQVLHDVFPVTAKRPL
ncbi:MAG: alpha/beta hydrolase [Desulfuromonadaceae bacterium]|nr:alpha/beta hydrolase [Desulfuromonadaceae bacterium]